MRRLWVCLFVTLLAVSASAGQKRFGRIVAVVSGGSPDTFSISDFTLDGAFQLTRSGQSDNSDPLYNKSLSFREVAGAAHVLTMSIAGNVYEYVVPALKSSPAAGGSPTYYNTATLYAAWGDVLGSGVRGAGAGGGTPPDAVDTMGTSHQVNCAGQDWGGSSGILWDQIVTNSRFWKTYRADYPQGDASYQACNSGAPSTADRFFGYGTAGSVVGTTGTATGVATYRTSTFFYKGLSRGLGEVPTAWRSSFGNRRIYVWGGGYSSLLCNPNIDDSAGPALALFDDTSPPADGTAISVTSPINFIGAYCSGAITSQTVPTLAFPRNNLATPSRSNVFDYLDQVTGLVMLDNGTKSGLLSFEWVIADNIQYNNSHLVRGGADSLLRIYKMSDIAAVYAASGANADDLTADTVTRITYPDVTYTSPGMAPSSSISCSSLTGTVGTINGAATCNSHGLTDGADVYFYGATDPTFNVSYTVVSHTTNGLVLSRDRTSDFFTASTASGTITVSQGWSNSPGPASCCVETNTYANVAVDHTNHKLYVMVPVAFTSHLSSSAADWRLVIYRYSY